MRLVVLILVPILALIAQQAVFRFNVGLKVENYSKFTDCKVLEDVIGSEDLEIDHKTGIAYVSSAPLIPKGSKSKLGIYKLDLATDKFTKMTLKDYPYESLDMPHGVSLYHSGDELLLFVVNHGVNKSHARDSVEIFKVKGDELYYVNSISHELLVNINDVKAISDHEFYVTSDHGINRRDHGTLAMLEDVFGLSIAYVTYCNVETKKCRKAIENISAPNGINYIPKNNMVYVALTMSGHMLAYKMDPVSRNLTFVESVYIDRGLDNIDVDEHGLLWVSAHPKILDVFMYMFNQTELSPFRVWKQIEAGKLNHFALVYSNSGEQLSGGSTAAHYKDDVLVGSVASHVMHCKVKK
jgi:sugar lactone lactonase YvrE